MKNLFNFLIIPTFLLGGLSQIHTFENSRAAYVEQKEGENKIAYLFFKVEKNGSEAEKVILQDRKISEGKLKYTPTYNRSSAKEGDFIITLTNAEGKEIVKQSVEDPLNPTMENFEDNIGRHKVPLQNAEFSIRYPHSGDIALLKVEKITNAGNKLLLTQKL